MMDTEYRGMKAMPCSERPTERLFAKGAEALSAAELMAVIIRCGNRKESALEAAMRIIRDCGGQARLAAMSATEISKAGKLGRVRAAQLKAALELGKRIAQGDMGEKIPVNDADSAAKLLFPAMRSLKKEEFRELLLDTKNRMIGMVTVSTGTLNSSLVHPREVFREAISMNSAALIIAHNHPSGDPTPSKEDISVTGRLLEAGRLLGIEIIDHLIIGGDSYVSFRETGILGRTG